MRALQWVYDTEEAIFWKDYFNKPANVSIHSADWEKIYNFQMGQKKSNIVKKMLHQPQLDDIQIE